LVTNLRRLLIFFYFIIVSISVWKLLKLTILVDTPDLTLGLFSALRALAFALWIAPTIYSWWMKRPAARYSNIARCSGIAFIVFDFMIIWIRAAEIISSKGDFALYLTSTHVGVHWLIRAGLSMIALFLTWKNRSRSMLGILILISIDLAYSGHSGSSPRWILATPVDVLHQWFYGIWTGGVLLLAWIDRFTALRSGQDLTALDVKRFSQLAKWCVLGLILTGALSAVDRFWTVTKVLNVDYGHTLLLKIVFFLLALSAAGCHLFYTQPKLSQNGSPKMNRLFGRALRLEITALWLVLFITGTLINSSLPDPNALEYDELVKFILIQPPLHHWGMIGIIGLIGLIATKEALPARR